MKQVSGAVAMAMLALATGAHAQSGPINHPSSGAMSAPHPVMEAAAMAPSPDIETSVSDVQARLQADVDQHKISRSKAALDRRKLKALQAQITRLNQSVAKIQDTLPEPDPGAAPPS